MRDICKIINMQRKDKACFEAYFDSKRKSRDSSAP
ncbi:hypothetical protein NP493_12g05012 [Ridgeia piscesae]|uniref:Uncharacterized protein n=1 Tax=Ridgeia piscesae TaxID=27915 RepID=A0AAD9ULA9_RIDPI|nr:hypothetical protein NP493_12g05012 [Ridgeia piscesae]